MCVWCVERRWNPRGSGGGGGGYLEDGLKEEREHCSIMYYWIMEIFFFEELRSLF